ncbi:hypothetical protein COP2_009678 [Malus domestica]
MSHLDPLTAQSEIEVRRIIDLQSIAQSMPYAFSDLEKVTRSHIPATNTPARINVPRVRQQHAWEGWTVPEDREASPSTWQGTLMAIQSSAPTMKRDKPLGSKDS